MCRRRHQPQHGGRARDAGGAQVKAPQHSDVQRAMLVRYIALPPTTRRVLIAACERPELALTDIAALCGISISNLRKRMAAAYQELEVEGRVHMVAVLGPILAQAYAPAPDDSEVE